MRISKYWKNKAIWFSKYAREEYNEGRALLATLGSAGITFNDDIERLIIALESINDFILANLLKNNNYMFPCGKSIKEVN